MQAKYYVLFIWADVEPQLHGPYGTEAERDAQALILRADDQDESGIYAAEINSEGALEVDSYSGAFFEGCD